MKKSVLSVLVAIVFIFTGTSIFSQNAYIKLGGGYGLSLAGSL